jgi:hypothetical protein
MLTADLALDNGPFLMFRSGHGRFMGRSFQSVAKRSRLPAVLKAARVISFLADVPVLSEKNGGEEAERFGEGQGADDGVVPGHFGPGPGARNRHDGFQTIEDHATALTFVPYGAVAQLRR